MKFKHEFIIHTIREGSESMKKISILFVLSFLLLGCTKEEVVEKEGSYTNTSGETTTAKVKMKNDSIHEVELDETTNGTTKKALKDDYGMKAASSIGKEWWEQAQFFEQYVQKNGIENITLNDEGKAENADVLTGCTIRIDGFIKAIQQAQDAVKSQK